MHDDSRVHVTRPTTGHQRGRRVARSEPSRQPGARIHVSRHERDSQRTPPPSILYPIYWRRVAKRTALPRESKEQNISPMSGNSSHEASCRVVSWRRIRESIHDEFSQSALSLSSHPPEAEAVNSLTQLNKFRKYLRGCNSRNFHSL